MVNAHVVLLQANKPVIGIVQDTLAGIRLMTKRDTFIEKDVFMNMLVRRKTLILHVACTLSKRCSRR